MNIKVSVLMNGEWKTMQMIQVDVPMKWALLVDSEGWMHVHKCSNIKVIEI